MRKTTTKYPITLTPRVSVGMAVGLKQLSAKHGSSVAEEIRRAVALRLAQFGIWTNSENSTTGQRRRTPSAGGDTHARTVVRHIDPGGT